MAQRVEVLLIDDLDGSDADETVAFALDGVSYEIDLTAANAAAMREGLATWVDAARRVKGSKRTGASPVRAVPTPAASSPGRSKSSAKNAAKGKAEPTREEQRRELRKVRDWAAANGHDINSRGRIPESVMDAYRDANGG